MSCVAFPLGLRSRTVSSVDVSSAVTYFFHHSCHRFQLIRGVSWDIAISDFSGVATHNVLCCLSTGTAVPYCLISCQRVLRGHSVSFVRITAVWLRVFFFLIPLYLSSGCALGPIPFNGRESSDRRALHCWIQAVARQKLLNKHAKLIQKNLLCDLHLRAWSSIASIQNNFESAGYQTEASQTPIYLDGSLEWAVGVLCCTQKFWISGIYAPQMAMVRNLLVLHVLLQETTALVKLANHQ